MVYLHEKVAKILLAIFHKKPRRSPDDQLSPDPFQCLLEQFASDRSRGVFPG